LFHFLFKEGERLIIPTIIKIAIEIIEKEGQPLECWMHV